MKKMLPLFLAALVGLASCSKSDSNAAQPAPAAPLEATWTFRSESVLTTPKNGSAPTTNTQPIPAGAYTVTFAGGVLTTTRGTSTSSGTYTYNGNTITIPTTGPNGLKTQTLTVTELTTTRLVTTEQTEDTANKYTTTDTFAR